MRLRQHGVCPRDGLAHLHRRGRRANRTIGAARQPPSTRFQQHPRVSPAPIHLHRPVPRVKQARRGGSERDHLRSAFGLLPSVLPSESASNASSRVGDLLRASTRLGRSGPPAGDAAPTAARGRRLLEANAAGVCRPAVPVHGTFVAFCRALLGAARRRRPRAKWRFVHRRMPVRACPGGNTLGRAP